MAGEAAFHILRPFCVCVAEQPSIEHVTRLQQQLEKYESSQLQAIQEYIIFPLKLGLLREKRLENETISLVNCLKCLLSLTEVTTWKLFADLLLKLLMLISSQTQEIKVQDCSEDLKLSVVECIHVLVQNTPKSVKMPMYETAFCPALGHMVFVLLRLSEKETLRSLRVTSMNTITLLFGLNSNTFNVNESSEVVRSRLAAFLPGICIAMAQIGSADPKQGHAVTVAALDTWTQVVTFCLQSCGTDSTSKETSPPARKDVEVPDVKRTREWIDSTASKLQILLKRMLLLLTHSHHKVRLALTDLVWNLLLHCRSSFQDSFVPLLECAISMSHDTNDVVAERNQKLIHILSEQELQRPLVDTLEDSVYNLTSRLPRILNSADEKEKLVVLNLLCGYINILDSRMESLLHSTPHLNRLCQALLHIAQPDTKNVPLVLPVVGTPSSGCLKFQHFMDNEIALCLKQVCQLLGLHGDLFVLTDYLQENMDQNCSQREGAVLILNFLIEGVAEKDTLSQEYKDIIRQVMNYYTSSCLWEDERKVILKGLLLEGLTSCAQIIDLGLEVEDLLCLFLEQAGVSSQWVTHSAQTALLLLASTLGHGTVTEMVSANADYLVHNLSLRLVHFTEYPALPGLLKTLFNSGNQESLLLFQDIILQVLRTMDAVYGNRGTSDFLNVLQTLTHRIKDWFPSLKAPEETLSPATFESSQSILNFVAQHDATVKASRCCEDELNTPEDGLEDQTLTSEATETDKPRQQLLHVQITCQILERCSHLLRTADVHSILLSLDIIQCGINILLTHQDDLLPAVHQLWESFQDLFRTNHNHVILYDAFETLMLLAGSCKGFIYRRTLEGVWPNLLHFLEKQLQLCKQKQRSPQQTQRLIILLLSKLGKLALLLGLEGNPLNHLCHVCLSFLEVDRRHEVQQACASSLSDMQTVDGDAIWWWVTRASCLPTGLGSSPGPEFRDVKLPVHKTYPDASVIMLHAVLGQ